MNFLPHTDREREAMLAAIGKSSVEELFADIPQELRQNLNYTVLPETGQCEQELQRSLKTLAEANEAGRMSSFLGGGAYHRFIPMAVNTIAGRSEFYTAYTPYQPEISQGTLQVGYEFQTMISELTGMDVANASVYDGGTAVAEAAFMAVRVTKRKHILIARGVHPDYRRITQTYVDGLGEVTLTEIDLDSAWQNDINGDEVACVILQQPNYLGELENVDALRAFCQGHGALMVVSADPVSLGLLQAPGDYGADIVVGDIQPLGNNLSFGGPYGGFMATRNKFTRQLPGRLVGRTVDKTGRPCYTLTLQTREQHIRRAKATSNICTNQALNILKATVYLTLVGPRGLRQVADVSVRRAHALAEGLTQLPGVELVRPNKPFFSEFAVKLPVPVQSFLSGLASQGILGGIPLNKPYPEIGNALLISVTETTDPADMDRYVEHARRLIGSASAPTTKEVCPR